MSTNSTKHNGDILKYILNTEDYTSILNSIESIISQVKAYENKKSNKPNKLTFQDREIFSKINQADEINIEEEKFYSVLKKNLDEFDSINISLLSMNLDDYKRRKIAFINVLIFIYLITSRISLII